MSFRHRSAFPARAAAPSAKPARARVRHTPGEMNKLEARFASFLAEQKMVGTIVDFGFERLKLKLAPKCFLTPDFDAITDEGFMDFFEVKGFWEDDARVKIKVVAQQFPHFGFIGVTWDSKGKCWQFERFGG